MSHRQYRLFLTVACAILVFGLSLTGCSSGRFSPHGWGGPTISGDALYVVSLRGDFLSVNLANHSKRLLPIQADQPSSGLLGCQGSAPSLVAYATPLVTPGTAVYVAAYDGTVFALDKKTGAELWRYKTEGHIVGSPAIDETDGNPLVIASSRNVYALDTKRNGLLAWNEPFKADGIIWSGLAVYQNKVYFGDMKHKLYAVDLDSGKLAWPAPRALDGAVVSTPLIANGTIFIGTFGKKFYALDATTGQDVWEHPFEAEDWFWNRATYLDGTIYVGSLGGVVYAIDTASGALKWRYATPTGDRIRASMAIAGDVLVVGSQDDSVYGLDIQTGRQTWAPIRLGADVLADPWVDGNIVYFLTQDDNLHALDAESGVELGWSPLSLG